MRLIKMFGLALIAAAAVTAFVGATSASAVTSLEEVVVCKTDHMASGTCPSAFGANTKLDAQLVAGTEAQLSTNLGTVKCNESTTSGETTTALAHGKITAVTFNNNGGPCKLGETNCTVTNEHLPYLVLVLLTTNHTEYHAVVSEEGTNGKPRANVNCGSALNCNFGSAEVLFTVLLETHDTVWDVNQSLDREGGSGFFCPATSTWNAKYLARCLEPAGTFVDCWPSMESGSVL